MRAGLFAPWRIDDRDRRGTHCQSHQKALGQGFRISRRTGEPGCSRIVPKANAAIMKRPRPAASIRYSGQCRFQAPVVIGCWIAELAITFTLMTVILHVSNNVRRHRFTCLCAGALVAAYITLEAPLSGMSMNPARTLASAVPAQRWTALWIYFAAPITGMLSAAELYFRTNGARSIVCAKLHHDNPKRCIFCGKPPHNASFD